MPSSVFPSNLATNWEWENDFPLNTFAACLSTTVLSGINDVSEHCRALLTWVILELVYARDARRQTILELQQLAKEFDLTKREDKKITYSTRGINIGATGVAAAGGIVALSVATGGLAAIILGGIGGGACLVSTATGVALKHHLVDKKDKELFKKLYDALALDLKHRKMLGIAMEKLRQDDGLCRNRSLLANLNRVFSNWPGSPGRPFSNVKELVDFLQKCLPALEQTPLMPEPSLDVMWNGFLAAAVDQATAESEDKDTWKEKLAALFTPSRIAHGAIFTAEKSATVTKWIAEAFAQAAVPVTVLAVKVAKTSGGTLHLTVRAGQAVISNADDVAAAVAGTAGKVASGITVGTAPLFVAFDIYGIYRQSPALDLSRTKSKEVSLGPDLVKMAEFLEAHLTNLLPVAKSECITFLPINAAKECMKCQETFSSFVPVPMMRRGNCRICGLVFCRKCSNNWKTLAEDGSESARICDLCNEDMSFEWYYDRDNESTNKEPRLICLES